MLRNYSMRAIWELVKSYKLMLFLISFFNVSSAVFNGSTMAILVLALEVLIGEGAQTFSSALGPFSPIFEGLQKDLPSTQLFLLLMGVAVAFQWLYSGLRFGSVVVSSYMHTQIQADLKRRLLDQFVSMSYAQINRYKIGDLISYMDQTLAVSRILVYMNTLLGTVLNAIVYVVVLIWLSPTVTLASLTVVALMALFIRYAVERVRVYAKVELQEVVAANADIAEVLQGMRLLRTFSRERYALERVGELIRAALKAGRRSAIWAGVSKPFIEAFIVAGLALIIVTAYFLAEDSLTEAIPWLFTFVYVLSRLMILVSGAGSQISGLSNQWPIFERIIAMLETKDKEYMKDGEREFQTLKEGIAFRDVTLHYIADEAPALHELNMFFPRGQMVALVGESGAGKSSVIDLILRLYDPTGGKILIDGVPLPEWRIKSWRTHIGVVEQSTFVFHASIRENIAFGKLDASEEEIVAAARAANAHEFIMDMAEGYDTVVGDRGQRLSGGQLQRIAIARALLRDPEIIILDEATSNLDSQSEHLIQQAIGHMREDRTIIVVAHRLSTINGADCIFVLEQGHLVEQGTHSELLDLNKRYARLWQLQSKDGNERHK